LYNNEKENREGEADREKHTQKETKREAEVIGKI
jgi:hypothetical protein